MGVHGAAASRFYAVNDRPVAVVPTEDGGADCVVFDFATGELVPDRAYFAYVTPGSGKDVDALTEAEFEARLAACRAEAGARAADQVLGWARRLCATSGAPAPTAQALGWRGQVSGTDVIVPAAPGYREIKVELRSGGRVAVELRPAGRLLSREILDVRLGPPRELPIPPDSWLEAFLAYQVTVAATPAQCTIIAEFRHRAASRLALRRDDPPG